MGAKEYVKRIIIGYLTTNEISYQSLSRWHVKVIDQNYRRQINENKNMRKGDVMNKDHHVMLLARLI